MYVTEGVTLSHTLCFLRLTDLKICQAFIFLVSDNFFQVQYWQLSFTFQSHKYISQQSFFIIYFVIKLFCGVTLNPLDSCLIDHIVVGFAFKFLINNVLCGLRCLIFRLLIFMAILLIFSKLFKCLFFNYLMLCLYPFSRVVSLIYHYYVEVK